MKKALCLMLALLMISGGLAALGETSDGTHFEPTLVNAMNRTSVQWAATESNRAWLTLLIALDFMKAIDSDSALSPD